jgi:Uma2 family endonuclease
VVYNSDLRIKAESSGLLTYPDLSVVCGDARFIEGTDDTVLNPTLLAEVLSGSTEAYDRGKKFENYRQIASLKEYLLVSQNEPRIDQFVRQPHGWVLNEVSGMEQTLEIPSLGITISLGEVFAKVNFDRAPMRVATPPRS